MFLIDFLGLDHVLANQAAFGTVSSASSHCDVGIVIHGYMTVSLVDGPALQGPILRVRPSWKPTTTGPRKAPRPTKLVPAPVGP